jgi:hypothetical protein
VAGEDSGVASGLQNASFQIGGAIGVAAVSAVATAGTSGITPVALTHGYRIAFATVWIFIVIGLAGCGVLLTRSRSARLEPVAS